MTQNYHDHRNRDKSNENLDRKRHAEVCSEEETKGEQRKEQSGKREGGQQHGNHHSKHMETIGEREATNQKSGEMETRTNRRKEAGEEKEKGTERRREGRNGNLIRQSSESK